MKKINFPYDLKNFEKTNIEGLFGSTSIKTEEVKKENFTILRKFGALFSFIVFSIIGGVLLSLMPLVFLSAGVISAENPVDYWQSLPSELESVSISERNVLYDINGDPFAEVWAQNRVLLNSVDEISPYAIRALIDTEDQRFYDHSGIDTTGTARSVIYGTGGGSGITQQLVKNLQFYNFAGTSNREEATAYTLDRKIQELKYSFSFEEDNTKNQILLEYFNTVAFGDPNIYSIEAASNYFFGKSAKDLDLAEASALIGTVQNPSVYNMSSEDTTEWKDRQKQVLQRMVEEEDITQVQADAAYSEELIFTKENRSGNCSASKYPFYCDYVISYLLSSEKLGSTEEERKAILARGGLQIYTYLEPRVLDSADAILEANFTNTNRVVAPVAVVQPGTGGVIAIAVNREYGKDAGSTEINVPLNPTGTGSTYKMFTLAAALNNGFTEEDLAFDSRCPLKDPNYDMPASGSIKNSSSCSLQGGYLDYKQATAFSSNTWFTELIIKVGVENVKDFSASVGLNAPDNMGSRSVSYTLGPVSNSPVDMAAAFATFANEGTFCPATPIMSYSYKDGTAPEIPESYDPTADSCRKVMSTKSAGIVLQAMRANISGEIRNSFGSGKNIPGYDTVAKSGTNQLYNLSWEHLSAQYSLFINVYDMDKLINEIDYIDYKGQTTRWFNNAAADTGYTLMGNIMSGLPNIPLTYESDDTSIEQIATNNKDLFTVPSVIGMTPEAALSVLESTGITVHISSEKIKTDKEYLEGMIIDQSISPGENLSVGTKKELILFIGE